MSAYKFNVTPQEVPEVQTKFREIKTQIPAPGTAEILERLNNTESRSMQGQLPIIWAKADDFSVYDIAGNRWIDFTSTIFVANVGHSNAAVTSAMKALLEEPLYSCYAYGNVKRVEYLEKLISFCGDPFQKAFLLSAGTEATEAAMKLMRMHAKKTRKKRRGIICVENNWHGRTLGAQMMSSNLPQREWIGYHDKDIHFIAFPYPWQVDEANGAAFFRESIKNLELSGVNFETDICGFMLETFQGWGAVFYPKSFVQEIENFCRTYGILLTFDEMQAGFGRTGRKFGYMHYGVTPDLICVGKGMGGGVPLSGVVGRADILDLPEIGNMSSTHSANPLVCVAGMAVLEELETKNLVAEAERRGQILRTGLEAIKKLFPDQISWVLGEGLIMAVIFRDKNSGQPDAKTASQVSERCMMKGLLVVHTGRESIKIGPPLTISDAALLEGIAVFKEAIAEILAE